MVESKDRRLARDYLLRRISEQQRELVGRRIFEEEGFFELVEIVEDELIDLYASGELGDHEKREVEEHLLTQPQATERLQLSRDLMRVAARFKKSRILRFFNWKPRFLAAKSASLQKVPSWAVAGVAALLLVALLALFWNLQIAKDLNFGLSSEESGLATARDGEAEELAADAGGRFRGVLTLLLAPARLRSAAEIPTVVVNPSVEWLELRFPLEEEDLYLGFRMSLESPDGKTITGPDRLEAESLDGFRLVRLRISTDQLSAGRWEAALIGVTAEGFEEPLSYSYFQVVMTN